MESFLKDFINFFGFVLKCIANGFLLVVSEMSKWISDFLSELDIPMLPSRSKILYHSYTSNSLLVILIIYTLFINAKAYTLFASDKENARRKQERISEARLLKYCFLGGAFGGFLGMKIHRHKTKKPLFTITVSLLLIIQLILFSFIFGFFAFWIYLS